MFIKLGLMVNLSMLLDIRSCPSVVANWTILSEFKNVCNDRTNCMCKMILFRKINPCKYFLAASSNQAGEMNFFSESFFAHLSTSLNAEFNEQCNYLYGNIGIDRAIYKMFSFYNFVYNAKCSTKCVFIVAVNPC